MKRIKVALVGSGQHSFPGDRKAQFSRSVSELTQLSQTLGFDLYVYESQVVSAEDAKRAMAAVEENKADFLLVQCISFSAGFLATIFAKVQNAYLGLWAIPEGAQDGPVPFNSFCSINMYGSIIGHYLKDDHIPFKWFYGFAGDPLFDERFAITIRAITAIRNMQRSRVALVGGIAPGFNDLYFDERTLLRRFEGMEISRLHEFAEIADRAKGYETQEITDILEATRAESEERGIHPKSVPLLETNVRVYKAFRDFIDENQYDALAVSCWPKFQQAFARPFSVCQVVGTLNDEGIPTACEGDLPSAVSMLLLRYIASDDTTLMDLSAFDEDDQTILMWHCGPTAKRFMNKDRYSFGVNYTALPHEEGKGINCCGIAREMIFAPGQATIARLTGESDKLFLASGRFIDYEKKSYHGSRGWMGDLSLDGQSISVRDFINTILVQRFQHHYPVVLGDYTDAIMEVTSWLGLRTVTPVAYQHYMQNSEG